MRLGLYRFMSEHWQMFFVVLVLHLFLLWSLWQFMGILLSGAGIDYVVSAEFEDLPESDHELEEWLQSQSGVYIIRVQREGNKVIWCWGYASTNLEDPVTPDLRLVFSEFGYRGMTNYQENKEYRDK